MDIVFKKGILGFENLTKYELLDIESNPILKELNSIEEKGVGFIVISPFEIYEDYEIVLSKDIIEKLEVKSPEDVMLLNIITIGNTLEESTINMKAPIVVNIRNNYCMQIILQDEKYNIKHQLVRG